MKKDEWNLDSLTIKDDVDYEEYWKGLEEVYRKFITKWKERKDYLEKPEILKEAFDEYEEMMREYAGGGKMAYYYSLKNAQNQDDLEIKAKLNQFEEKITKLGNEIQFFGLNISKIPHEKQRKFLDYGGLKEYRHHLESSFKEAKHLLSNDEEKIMNLKSSTSHSKWVEMVERIISKKSKKVITEEGIKEISFSEIMGLISSTNKKVRDSAASAINEVLREVVDVAEEEMNAILYDNKVTDELRKFKRPDEGRHLGDDIDTEVVDSLLKAVTENFELSKKYYHLKARLFGLKKLEYHERNVPYGRIDKKYSYDDSVRLVTEVFRNLDGEFADIFNSFVKNGQMDVHPRKGKMGGAFCTHLGKNHPTFILLNHTDRLQDVLTIAHETGHGINNEMIRKKQNAINFGTPKSTAEVASTFMEDFVLQKLFDETDDEELKLSLMMMKLNEDASTIFRQAACYNFETELHKTHAEKGFLSKEEIGKIFSKHMHSYMGDFVEQNEGSENWWVYWSHLRNFFYVYSYVSGLLISKSMQAKVKKDKKFISKVKEFLASGTSDSPKNIFVKMGIDITDKKFWLEGIHEFRDLLDETEKLAKKLGKIE